MVRLRAHGAWFEARIAVNDPIGDSVGELRLENEASGREKSRFALDVEGLAAFFVETKRRRRVKLDVLMIIAVVNQKGGVGKTTTTLNLGAALLARNETVRMLDLDNQKSLSFMAEGIESLRVQVADPSTLEPILSAEKADFILLDCPPALGEITAAALKRAHLVIAPTPPRVLDLAGLSQLKATIAAARQRVNPNLKLRILLTLRDARITLQNDYETQLRRAFAGEMFQTVIPRAAIFERAADAHQTLLDFAPRSPGSEAFRLLAEEVRQLEEPKNG